jgi:hypothetical protein
MVYGQPANEIKPGENSKFVHRQTKFANGAVGVLTYSISLNGKSSSNL